ncbi:hypothetical protein BWQ96_05663 [Gracilariopsis chorda]|uniref:Uncharacterized protein n=1 Tax=Gracilariopsis chorda TaxID=448386 RepID=A0A2V3IR43_9FLOR|nr:hypothetical protein BWQ96_05663 [Gracilariopsis chorda]|eukprot:PXF44586.1 hypothetical protein BWQ96_05663 [Gracilariopsis chorda]
MDGSLRCADEDPAPDDPPSPDSSAEISIAVDVLTACRSPERDDDPAEEPLSTLRDGPLEDAPPLATGMPIDEEEDATGAIDDPPIAEEEPPPDERDRRLCISPICISRSVINVCCLGFLLFSWRRAFVLTSLSVSCGFFLTTNPMMSKITSRFSSASLCGPMSWLAFNTSCASWRQAGTYCAPLILDVHPMKSRKSECKEGDPILEENSIMLW